MNATALEAATKSNIVLDKELKCTGIANALSPILGGGIVSYHDFSNSKVCYHVTQTKNFASITVAIMSVLILFFGFQIIEKIPRFVVSGLILYLGIDICISWILQSLKNFSKIEFTTLIIIAIVIFYYGFLQGIVFGLAITLIIFVLNHSRLQIIRMQGDCRFMRSNVDRDQKSRDILDKKGGAAAILKLQGIIFFGNSTLLYDHVKALLQSDNEQQIHYVLLDFSQVIELDSSATYSFVKLYNYITEKEIQLLFSNVSSRILGQLRLGISSQETDPCLFFDDLDRGLEYCEKKVLSKCSNISKESIELEVMLNQIIDDKLLSSEIRFYLSKICSKKGDVIYRQYEQADDMFFLIEGYVDILIEAEGNKDIRLKTIGPGNFIGEMGLFTNMTRTASVVCKEACKFYRLDKKTLQRMRDENPKAALCIDSFIITQLSSRLAFSNKQVRKMQQ